MHSLNKYASASRFRQLPNGTYQVLDNEVPCLFQKGLRLVATTTHVLGCVRRFLICSARRGTRRRYLPVIRWLCKPTQKLLLQRKLTKASRMWLVVVDDAECRPERAPRRCTCVADLLSMLLLVLLHLLPCLVHLVLRSGDDQPLDDVLTANEIIVILLRVREVPPDPAIDLTDLPPHLCLGPRLSSLHRLRAEVPGTQRLLARGAPVGPWLEQALHARFADQVVALGKEHPDFLVVVMVDLAC
mmetsp:Transcript_30797/g.77936  ORF Transcript_30797/g.77936 Transcript_30797/m.77936 type:complete len:244 (+) Transcript_30797:261-992(+)